LGALVLLFNLANVGVLNIFFNDLLHLLGLTVILTPNRNHLLSKLLLPNLCLLSLVTSFSLLFTELLSVLLTMTKLLNKVLLVFPLDVLNLLCPFPRLFNLLADSLFL
jgi:hypothetical protein